TRLAVQQAHEAAALVAEHPRRKFTATLVKLVAETLGNTPAVCEKYYIHPKVLTALTERFERKSALPRAVRFFFVVGKMPSVIPSR
ncbi:MAG: hypothetical protein ACPH5G_18120, partial [Pseudooceanicola atlanticus]